MPKIRDLGISVIPVTMRPPEIGGGAADAYMAQCDPTSPPHCDPTIPDPDCHPTNPDPDCHPTNPEECTPTPQCCPTNDPQSVPCSRAEQEAAALPHDAVMQLKQQLQHQIGAELLN